MTANGKKPGKKPGKAQKKNAVKRSDNGKWLKGKEGGPGRPKCSLNWMTRFSDWAAKRKMTLEQASDELIEKLWDLGVNDGDMRALDILANRVYGGIDRGPIVAIQNNTITGPPLPEGGDQREYIPKYM